MNQTLHISRMALDRNPEQLREILLDHVRSERSATEILVQLDRARHDEDVSYFVVYPSAARLDGEYGGDTGWQMRIVSDLTGDRETTARF